MKIKDATFITSVASADKFYKTDKPIIAICGKSNVGKSSLINMLANRRKLAKTSVTPGRTRLINYFDFGEFVLADLPGYGFAKVNKEEKVFTLLLLVGSFVLDVAWFVVYAKKDEVLYGIEWVMWKVCYAFSIVGVVCKVALGVVLGGIAFEKGNVQEMKHLIMD